MLSIGEECTGYFRENSSYICFVLGDHLSFKRTHGNEYPECSRGREDHEETWRLYFYPVWLCGVGGMWWKLILAKAI